MHKARSLLLCRGALRLGPSLALMATFLVACGAPETAEQEDAASAPTPSETVAGRLLQTDELGISREALANGGFLLHPQGNANLCLDVALAKNADGTNVQIAKCNGGAAQAWTHTGNMWQIYGNKCLNVRNGANQNGTRLQIWTCNDADINNLWNVVGSQLQWKKNTKMCLDVVDGVLRDGTAVQIWTCDGKAANVNQLWKFAQQGAARATPAPASQPAASTPATKPATPAATNNPSLGYTPAGLDVAPYFWTWAQWGDYLIKTLQDGMSKVKLTSATLAFELSAGAGKCSPQGNFAAMASDIAAFRKAGNRLILSYGGATDTPPYLQKACGDATSLANVLAKQMDTYDTHFLDFDIEGDNVGDTTSNNRLVAALSELQARYSDLYVSFTLPVDAYSGLSTAALAIIEQCIASKVKVSRVNLMTMDYGQMPPAGKSAHDMVTNSVEVTVAQLKKLYPSVASADIYHMIGITPLIGQNDPPSSGSFYFTVSDAQAVATYAKQKGIGLLSYWGLMRDRSGSNSSNGDYSNTPQTNYQFLNIFRSAQ